MDRSSSVLVVGASNYDIYGKVIGHAIQGDSNPSGIYASCGGVGRNIAENLARLGVDTALISAYGDDAFAGILKNSCTALGIDISRSVTIPGVNSDTYVSILDNSGDLIIGSADTGALESVNPELMNGAEEYISEFPIVFADTNSEELLRYTAYCVRGALFVDAVSVKKASRVLPIINMVDTLKVNRAELTALTGRETDTSERIKDAAAALMEKGLHRLFVTMGAEGCGYMNAFGWYDIPAIPTDVKSVSGAGDAFAAAMTWGSIMGHSDRDILLLSAAAASIALKSESAVNPELTRDAVIDVFRKYHK